MDRLQNYPKWNRVLSEIETVGITLPRNKKLDRSRVILVQAFEIPEWALANAVFADCVADFFGAHVITYGPRRYPAHWFRRLFKTSVNDHVDYREARMHRARAIQIVKRDLDTIHNNGELLNYTIDGLNIGQDVYESYLRLGHKTIDLADPALSQVFQTAVEYLFFWRTYLETHDVAAVLPSHDCYIELNILNRLAYTRGIPVYLANPRGVDVSTGPNSIARRKFSNYKPRFRQLPPEMKEELLFKAEDALVARLKGNLSVDMPYATISAFKEVGHEVKLSDPNTPSIVIATHCFYDNPHAYGGMLFSDFWEWLNFVGYLSMETNFNWLLKTHPDPLPGTREALQALVETYPRLALLDTRTTWHDLRRVGVRHAHTCYGSIGHELPLLGFSVINGGFNPHSGYRFNLTAESKPELARLLLNFPSIDIEVDPKEVYEFYAAHYFLSNRDDFIFDSNSRLVTTLAPKEQRGPQVATEFLRQDVRSKVSNTQQLIREFLLRRDLELNSWPMI